MFFTEKKSPLHLNVGMKFGFFHTSIGKKKWPTACTEPCNASYTAKLIDPMLIYCSICFYHYFAYLLLYLLSKLFCCICIDMFCIRDFVPLQSLQFRFLSMISRIQLTLPLPVSCHGKPLFLNCGFFLGSAIYLQVCNGYIW